MKLLSVHLEVGKDYEHSEFFELKVSDKKNDQFIKLLRGDEDD